MRIQSELMLDFSLIQLGKKIIKEEALPVPFTFSRGSSAMIRTKCTVRGGSSRDHVYLHVKARPRYLWVR